MNAAEKERTVLASLRALGSVAVAFSGGADSSLVCSLAKEALGDKAIAVIGMSPLDPIEELGDARRTAGEIGIKLFEIEVPAMSDDRFVRNPADRCYYCKSILFKAISDLAKKHGISSIADGSSHDDLGDSRPGMRAKQEFHVISPLLEAGITKEEVREISRSRGLRTWDRPSAACLASRIPYGTEITEELLERIGRVERFLRENGFRQVRVRAHGDIARIEVDPEEMQRLLGIKDEVAKEFKKAGFIYITIDLEGYRTGSMNEVL